MAPPWRPLPEDAGLGVVEPGQHADGRPPVGSLDHRPGLDDFRVFLSSPEDAAQDPRSEAQKRYAAGDGERPPRHGAPRQWGPLARNQEDAQRQQQEKAEVMRV